MSIYLTIFGKPRYLGLVEIETPSPERGSRIVAETMRGLELAVVGGPLSLEQEDRYRNTCTEDPSEGQPKGGEPMLQNITFVRMVTVEDLEIDRNQRVEEELVLIKAREILSQHDLPMKLVDVEYLLDRKKLFFYFTSEQRVDFRAYVRDLAREFKTRIELRQIGVRDEAKTVRGLGPCGKECCCGYWLHKFDPICIKMVKEQNLALNPTKISGICGRLMCCMAYEHETYGSIWKDLPNPGSKIKTPTGNYVILGVDLQHEAFRAKTPEGTEILVLARNFEAFKETVMRGEVWDSTIGESGIPALPVLGEDESGESLVFSENDVMATVITDVSSIGILKVEGENDHSVLENLEDVPCPPYRESEEKKGDNRKGTGAVSKSGGIKRRRRRKKKPQNNKLATPDREGTRSEEQSTENSVAKRNRPVRKKGRRPFRRGKNSKNESSSSEKEGPNGE